MLHRAEIATNPAYKLRSIKYDIGTLEESTQGESAKSLPSIEGNKNRSRAQRLADVDPLTFALFEPQTADQTLFQTRRLRQAVAFQAISVDELISSGQYLPEVVWYDPSGSGQVRIL